MKLLDDSKTYENTIKDPTKKFKDELSAILLDLKRRKVINYNTGN